MLIKICSNFPCLILRAEEIDSVESLGCSLVCFGAAAKNACCRDGCPLLGFALIYVSLCGINDNFVFSLGGAYSVFSLKACGLLPFFIAADVDGFLVLCGFIFAICGAYAAYGLDSRNFSPTFVFAYVGIVLILLADRKSVV